MFLVYSFVLCVLFFSNVSLSVDCSRVVGSKLTANNELAENECLSDQNGKYTLRMQQDGNVVITDITGREIWYSGTNGHGSSPYKLVLQADNNLVVKGNDKALWSSNTMGLSWAKTQSGVLELEMTGNLVLKVTCDRNPQKSSPVTVWESNTQGYTKWIGCPDDKELDLVMSLSGPIDGKRCIHIDEPSDPQWRDNWLCYNSDCGDQQLSWSVTGRPRYLRCTQIYEDSDPNAAWKDNYLCVPYNSVYHFGYVQGSNVDGEAGISQDQKNTCISLNEPAKEASKNWGDNKLCYRRSESFELAHTFAPYYKFDQEASTFPMDAEMYYFQEVLNKHDNDISESVCIQTETLVDLVVWKDVDKFRRCENRKLQDIPTYFRVVECGGKTRILYNVWYGYQYPCLDMFWGTVREGHHDADWEQIMVTLSNDKRSIESVTYWQHGGHYTRPRNDFELHDSTHPVVYVGKIAHGSYHSDERWRPLIDYPKPLPKDIHQCEWYGDFRYANSHSVWEGQKQLIDLDSRSQLWMRDETFSTHGASKPQTEDTTDEYCNLAACDEKEACASNKGF